MEAIVVLGATATGKSSLALRLAERLDGEIVNADALQIYRHFDRGTAKPSAAERRRVPHHLVDFLDPTETFSAGDYGRRAREVVVAIRSRAKLPLIVGGSGLYLRALIEGLVEMPAIDPALRRELRRRHESEGLPALRAELLRVDPETARRLTPGDSQRILRALEIWLETGRPMSAWLREARPTEPPLAVTKIGLTLPRALLYDKISDRARAMLESGWVREVGELMKRYPLESPAFQAIGYRELARALARGSEPPSDGRSSSGLLTAEELELVARQIITATRRYAKRQETWFRKESGVRWLSPLEIEPLFEDLVQTLRVNFNPM